MNEVAKYELRMRFKKHLWTIPLHWHPKTPERGDRLTMKNKNGVVCVFQIEEIDGFTCWAYKLTRKTFNPENWGFTRYRQHSANLPTLTTGGGE